VLYSYLDFLSYYIIKDLVNLTFFFLSIYILFFFCSPLYCLYLLFLYNSFCLVNNILDLKLYFVSYVSYLCRFLVSSFSKFSNSINFLFLLSFLQDLYQVFLLFLSLPFVLLCLY